jgi:hypothetical protein
MCTALLIGRDRATSTSPTFGLIYEGAIGQPRETTSLCDPLVCVLVKLATHRVGILANISIGCVSFEVANHHC